MSKNLDAAVTALDVARNRLYVAVAERQPSKALADRLNDVAAAEGALAIQYQVEGRLPQDAIAIVTATVLNGPDDTWSGRTNDVRRAHGDGLRDAGRRILDDANEALAASAR